MTTTATVHPLIGKHRETLEEAKAALAGRTYYSRYPESPSPRVYGETAASEGKTAFEGRLTEGFTALADQPGDGRTVGSEVSPYGPELRVGYPHLVEPAVVQRNGRVLVIVVRQGRR